MNIDTDSSERDTLILAQAGDEIAFEQLLDAHYDRMYRFAYKWCGNVADAEDITQQACIKLSRSLSQFRFESSFTSWLYRLVINCAKDWHKSQQRHPESASDTDAALAQLSAHNEGEFEPGESIAYLEQIIMLLDQMAEGFKETALMVFAEGFSHAEAAIILGVKESTVSWRIHEIRKQLKVLTQEDML